jgi:predicted Zn-dependent protease
VNVTKIAPNNAAAQNNIAWLMSKQKKPGALALIESAVKLRPDQPEFLDTLAMILAEEKQLAKAIEIRKRTVALQPQNNDYRMSLAALYLQDGKKDLAKTELEFLARQGAKFANQAEVQRLLGQL